MDGGMRGYFGVGAERISKPMNFGAVLRTAHAFGAGFVFSVARAPSLKEAAQADTASTPKHVPYYDWPTLDDMVLPKGCALIGVELTPDAVELPRFNHPLRAAYLLGPERGSLSGAAQARCQAMVRIPTRFCVNLSVAAAIILYDRSLRFGGGGTRSGR